MKIGIDARIWSETTGRYVRNLVREIAKIDSTNQYFVFVRTIEKEKIEKEISQKNFNVVPTDITWHTLREQISYAKELEKYSLDLVHFTYFSLPINYKGRFIVTIHDLIIHHFPTGKASTLPTPLYYLKRFAYIYLVQKSADKAIKIITPTIATKEEVVEHLTITENKIRVIYEGFDENIKSDSKKNIIDGPYILYVGNAYPHKNLPRLIEAFQTVRKDNQKLVLVGRENFFYKRLKKDMKSKTDGVIFFGEATDSDLSNLYSNAMAFVMPSLMEGFGLPPIEAMAHNCFVIASNIPAISEVCEDAAIYFDPYKISDIADKIGFAFSDVSKTKYIEKGRERIKDFSWVKMARETLDIYESSVSLRQNK